VGAYGGGVLAALLSRRVGPDRAVPARLALGALCGCALIALVDPNESGRYPTCPTRALLGIDCPVCGTLRGLHSLSRGRIAEALNHNLLLLVAVPVGLVVWWRWLRRSLGRPVRAVAMPRWVVPAAVVTAAVFMVVRNLDVAPLTWLDSAA
jgi:Protein of unknown function (DUF2752)